MVFFFFRGRLGVVKTLSMDLRERILAAYDKGDATREMVARRFRVSLGMVKKLLAQRRKLGDIRPQHHRCGRKRRILASHRAQLRDLLAKRPDLTLAQMREALGLDCTLPAIHYVLVELGLTYKKRRSGPPSSSVRTSPKRAGRGCAGRASSTRAGWSSSTNPRRKRT